MFCFEENLILFVQDDPEKPQNSLVWVFTNDDTYLSRLHLRTFLIHPKRNWYKIALRPDDPTSESPPKPSSFRIYHSEENHVYFAVVLPDESITGFISGFITFFPSEAERRFLRLFRRDFSASA